MHCCGDFRTTYRKDMEIFQTPFIKVVPAVFLGFLLVLPVLKLKGGYLLKGEYLWILLQILIASIGAVGINILTGYTGQISLGQGAFLGVGAYTSAYVTAKMGLSFWVGIPAAGLVTALAGMVFGIPSLRLKGLYLAIATLASQFILEWIFVRWESVTGGSHGITIPRPSIAGHTFSTDRSYYYIVLAVAIVMILFAANLMRTRTGRAFMAVRDHYISAEIMGIHLFKYRLLSFGISWFRAGVHIVGARDLRTDHHPVFGLRAGRAGAPMEDGQDVLEAVSVFVLRVHLRARSASQQPSYSERKEVEQRGNRGRTKDRSEERRVGKEWRSRWWP